MILLVQVGTTMLALQGIRSWKADRQWFQAALPSDSRLTQAASPNSPKLCRLGRWKKGDHILQSSEQCSYHQVQQRASAALRLCSARFDTGCWKRAFGSKSWPWLSDLCKLVVLKTIKSIQMLCVSIGALKVPRLKRVRAHKHELYENPVANTSFIHVLSPRPYENTRMERIYNQIAIETIRFFFQTCSLN